MEQDEPVCCSYQVKYYFHLVLHILSCFWKLYKIYATKYWTCSKKKVTQTVSCLPVNFATNFRKFHYIGLIEICQRNGGQISKFFKASEAVIFLQMYVPKEKSWTTTGMLNNKCCLNWSFQSYNRSLVLYKIGLKKSFSSSRIAQPLENVDHQLQ